MAYSKESIECFLKHQKQLFDEPVAETPEEAAEFLEDCMAVEVGSLKEALDYLEESGMDTYEDTDPSEICELFSLPGGKYLIVEG